MIDFSHPEILECVRRALEEDIGTGDVTSKACVDAGQVARGSFLAREQQIVAGTELMPIMYTMRGGVDEVKLERLSGAGSRAGDVIATVRGRAHTLLECERVALNFLQHLGGIATLDRKSTRLNSSH